MNLRGAQPLVLSVVPLDQIAVHFGRGAETGQFAGASGALQGAGKDLRKGQSRQPFPKSAGVALAALSQRQIRQPGMLAGEAPGSLAMSREINRLQTFAHVGIAADSPTLISTMGSFIRC